MTALERKVNALIAVVTAQDEETRNSAMAALQDTDMQQTTTIEAEAEKLLMEFGVPCHLKGFDYLVKALCLVAEEPSFCRNITKELYPAIARKSVGETWTKVDRAIRHAVEIACNRCDPDILVQYFGNSIHPNKGKPVNSEFISTMARELKRRWA